jgi:hypothetical protein
VEHDNGAGQKFYDCNPVGTHTLATAKEAAQAWSPTGLDQSAVLPFPCSGGCFAWQTMSACGVWCYSGSYAGQVYVNQSSIACVCLFPGPPWN